jgi:hypothetical protein
MNENLSDQDTDVNYSILKRYRNTFIEKRHLAQYVNLHYCIYFPFAAAFLILSSLPVSVSSFHQ